MFIWERPDWPRFRWDAHRLALPLAAAHVARGRLAARLERLGFPLQSEAELRATTEETLRNAEIEGEILDRASVRSSLARRLGVPDGALGPEDQRVAGIVEVTLDATRDCAAPLTRERLWAWQAALFPTGRSGLSAIRVGAWRDDARGKMQVVSGPIGRETVHYEAPPAARIDTEMERFLAWFAAPIAIDGFVHAALAHLWFVTLHPFEDGNGRIARVLADMSLARSEASPRRFYSLSAQIRAHRAGYYRSLERTQRGDLDITTHLLWFAARAAKAVEAAETASAGVLHKAEFWQAHAGIAVNERQRAMLGRLLDGFQGKLTSRKWAALGRCSLPTAQRDIRDLIARGMLIRNPGGSRNASYRLDGA